MSKEKATEVGITDFEKPVVKENLTSEERAREYANSVLPYANDIDSGYEQRSAWNNARLGYLSALKDSEKELTAYREALKENIELLKSSTEYEVEFERTDCRSRRYVDAVLKAKQLLKEEEI